MLDAGTNSANVIDAVNPLDHGSFYKKDVSGNNDINWMVNHWDINKRKVDLKECRNMSSVIARCTLMWSDIIINNQSCKQRIVLEQCWWLKNAA